VLADGLLKDDDDMANRPAAEQRSTALAQADQARDKAEKLFQRRLEQLQGECRNLDASVNRFVFYNFDGHVTGNFTHVFYALFDASAFQGTFTRGSEPQMDDLRKTALTLRSLLETADEDARRADVSPGTRRSLRARYGFDEKFWVR
jgi:hypothetical protein